MLPDNIFDDYYNTPEDAISTEVKKSDKQTIQSTYVTNVMSLQNKLFWGILLATVLVLLSSTSVMILWMFYSPPIPTSVGVVYFSGVIAEIVTSFILLTKSLFPAEGAFAYLQHFK